MWWNYQYNLNSFPEITFLISLELLMCPDTFIVLSGRNLSRKWKTVIFFFYSKDKSIGIFYSDLLIGKLFLCFLFLSALIWQHTQLPACVVWPKIKLNSSGSVTPSYSRLVSCIQEKIKSENATKSLFPCCHFFPENTSTWTLYPTCNRNRRWRRREQISGNVLAKTLYCTHLFIVVFL